MEVEVRLFAGFRQGRFNRRPFDLPEGTCLRDVLQQLDIPQEEVSLPLVNGRYSNWTGNLPPATCSRSSRPSAVDKPGTLKC